MKNNKSNSSKYFGIDNDTLLSSLLDDTIDSSLSNTTTTSNLASASNTSSSSSNNYIYSGSITSTPGSVWVTPSTYTYNTANFNLDSLYSSADSDILKYLTEEEITDIIEKIISRCDDRSDVNKILKAALKARSFSEDFLLKYFDYIKDYKELVLLHHSGQIKSGEYKAIALAFEANKGE